MGWKMVRDNNETWCRAHGVSGTWRTAGPEEAARALRRKLGELRDFADRCKRVAATARRAGPVNPDPVHWRLLAIAGNAETLAGLLEETANMVDPEGVFEDAT